MRKKNECLGVPVLGPIRLPLHLHRTPGSGMSYSQEHSQAASHLSTARAHDGRHSGLPATASAGFSWGGRLEVPQNHPSQQLPLPSGQQVVSQVPLASGRWGAAWLEPQSLQVTLRQILNCSWVCQCGLVPGRSWPRGGECRGRGSAWVPWDYAGRLTEAA